MSPAEIGHTLTLVPTSGQVVVLALMLGCGIWAARAKTRLAFVALGACLLFWLRANSHLEGTVLISFSPAHGLTLADLLVPLVVAFVLKGQTERRKRDRRTDGRVGGRRATDPQPAEAVGEQPVEQAGDVLPLPQARTGEHDEPAVVREADPND
ncbi:hypothetical protein ACIB24_19140 [Spongisporangium articulatum]|uniref:Uncharacterized protein n=1 Tax=Spongisporangium articulatum TaxID=3362603 RepID=A0ABW8AS08_9ACTN